MFPPLLFLRHYNALAVIEIHESIIHMFCAFSHSQTAIHISHNPLTVYSGSVNLECVSLFHCFHSFKKLLLLPLVCVCFANIYCFNITCKYFHTFFI